MTIGVELQEVLIEALPGFICYWDTELRVRFANSRQRELTGLEDSAVLGTHMREILGAQAFAAAEPYARAALRGEPQDVERELRRPDGSLAILVVHYEPHWVDGKVVGIVAFVQNVAEPRRAQLEAEQRFARTFQSSPAAQAIRRVSDDRFLEVNDRYVELTGFSRADLVGKTPLEGGIDTAEQAQVRARLLAAARGPDGSVRSVELPHITKGGDRRIALASIERIDFGIEGPSTLTTFIDITDRKLAERRLSAQSDVSRVLAESTSLADAAPRILDALGRAEGWEVGALWELRQPRSELVCEVTWRVDDRERLAAITSENLRLRFASGEGGPGRVWKTGEAVVLADVRLDEDFQRRHVAERAGLTSFVGFPIRHGEEVFGVIDFLGPPQPVDPQLHDLLAGIGRQIGLFVERTRAVATLRISEERLQSVIENLSEGLVISTREGMILHWNPAARVLHGIPEEADWNRAVADFQTIFELSRLDGTVVPFDQWPTAKILRGETLRDCELRIRRLDLDWARVFSYGGALVQQPDGSQLAVLTINDISERMRRDDLRRQSEQLTEDNRRIQEASRLKSEFLANMSHELRTPLNAVIGFTSLLRGGKAGPISDTQSEYLDDVLKSSKHLLQLINDVLDLAKIESGRVDLKVAELDLNKVAGEVRDVVRGLAAQKNLALNIEVDEAVASVEVDERLLKQILYNYLSNAIKFTPAGGRVCLRVLPEDDASFRVEVEDTGIGISEADTKRLFVEFQQLDAGADKKYQGTGLGLALVKKCAEAQGGQVGVTSTPGKGSTFFAVLPRRVSGEGR